MVPAGLISFNYWWLCWRRELRHKIVEKSLAATGQTIRIGMSAGALFN
jgi:hypothetical protein